MWRLTRLAKTAFFGLYKYTGAALLPEALERRAGRQSLAILILHRVTDAIPADGLTVSTAFFERLCRLLRRGFRVVPLAEVFDIIRTGRPVPPRTVALTFDDTYRDNLFAARVLARHGLPATFFLATAYVGTGHVYDWDRHLPRLPNLTWDDVREMAALGFEIGSHTVTHANLAKLSFDAARQEIVESKQTLEKRIGRRVRWLAYPYGGARDIRPELPADLEEAGYEGCLSAYGGLVHPGCDARVLPRIPVPAFHNLLHVELYLRNCLHWIYALKRRLGGKGEPGSAPSAGLAPC